MPLLASLSPLPCVAIVVGEFTFSFSVPRRGASSSVYGEMKQLGDAATSGRRTVQLRWIMMFG